MPIFCYLLYLDKAIISGILGHLVLLEERHTVDDLILYAFGPLALWPFGLWPFGLWPLPMASSIGLKMEYLRALDEHQ